MEHKEILRELIEEMDAANSSDRPWTKEEGIPEFVTAANGRQRFFTLPTRRALTRFTVALYENRRSESAKMELQSFEKIVRQVIADMHASDLFCGVDWYESLQRVKREVDDRCAKIQSVFTHYISAWTLGFEKLKAFSLGPVTFLSQLDWIDQVEFSDRAKESYLNEKEANYQWKKILKEALSDRNRDVELSGLAGAVYDVVTQCPTLLKVTIQGYDLEFSRKLAKMVCRSALDMISLGLGAPEFFLQQALHEERLPPVGNDRIVETNGYLWLPGSDLGRRIPVMSPKRASEALTKISDLLPAFSSILDGLVTPQLHKHPKLASRWATALDWYAEGNREMSDAIALTKLGTCLDVLSSGGKNEGIRQMVVNLTGLTEAKTVVSGLRPRTLKELIKDIYDHGRSKILHGTHHDRLQSFSDERKYAAYLARIALIECALRLHTFTGDDNNDKAFRTIAPAI